MISALRLAKNAQPKILKIIILLKDEPDEKDESDPDSTDSDEEKEKGLEFTVDVEEMEG